ncbi:hypothetical protein KQX54_008458 [Cotesia glomerata]|uniref:Uncharacterized protein n=1 Tax=Cotesia glomerata TaxID=32391 RepID=A0AAV7IKK4_COTGL|nr:hypothetical protein KQX54_008458 [Cotesia glomerata]
MMELSWLNGVNTVSTRSTRWKLQWDPRWYFQEVTTEESKCEWIGSNRIEKKKEDSKHHPRKKSSVVARRRVPPPETQPRSEEKKSKEEALLETTNKTAKESEPEAGAKAGRGSYRCGARWGQPAAA